MNIFIEVNNVGFTAEKKKRGEETDRIVFLFCCCSEVNKVYVPLLQRILEIIHQASIYSAETCYHSIKLS